MKNNSWKTSYLVDFQVNSYLLLYKIAPLNISRATLIQFTQIYVIYLKFLAILFSYSLLNLSSDILLSHCPTKICKDLSCFIYDVYPRHTSPSLPVSFKHFKNI